MKPIGNLRSNFLSFILTAGCLFVRPVEAHDLELSELMQLSLKELLSIEVVTASKIPESWASASSSTTLITSGMIQKSGAESLFDLLRMVPGISVDYDSRNVPSINIRGFNQSPILYLLNGEPLGGVMSGDAKNISVIYLPVSNIKHIEVVRGPGSSLYGANALIGMVNITTFDGDDLKGTSISADDRFESKGNISKRFGLLTGNTLGDNGAYSFNLEHFDSNGPQQIIKADSDGKSGQAYNGLQSTDLQGKFKQGNFSLFARYNTYLRDDFLGLTDYIANAGEESADLYSLSANWKWDTTSRWQITTSLFIDHRDMDWLWDFFPASSGATSPGARFEDWNQTGLTSNLLWKERKAGVDVLNVFQASDVHTIVAGIAGERQRSLDIRHIANQNPGFLPLMSDVSDQFNWNAPATRTVSALYLQDTWQINHAIKSNLGVRVDNYSDFGSTTNPRLALIWGINEDHHLKLLYGEAFRAPDFGDLYAENLFGANGNPDLKPEKIKTLELSISSVVGKNLFGHVTLFDSKMTDLIVSGQVARNEGENKTRGVETEFRYELTEGSYIAANYTYNNATQNGHDFREAPKHKGNIQFNWKFKQNFNANFLGYFQSDAPTISGVDNHGYGVWSATLIASDIIPKTNIKLSINNVFDKNYQYPGRSIPSGYDAPGRSIQVGISYRFDD